MLPSWQKAFLHLILALVLMGGGGSLNAASRWQASSEMEGFSAALAGDGLTQPPSCWVSAPVTSTSPQWLMVDLGTPLSFTALKLWNSGASDGGNYYSPQRGYLQGTNDEVAWSNPDKVQWQEIATFSFPNKPLEGATLTFARVNYRYVRLFCLRSWVPDGRVEIAEWQLLPNLVDTAEIAAIDLKTSIQGQAVGLAVDVAVRKTFAEAAEIKLVIRKEGEVLAQRNWDFSSSPLLVSHNIVDPEGINLYLPPPLYEVEVTVARGTILARQTVSKVVGIEKAKDLFVSPFQDPSLFDKYGGYRALKGRATGYFHTEKIGDRWWFITPEGNAFWSLSMDVLMMLAHWSQPHVAFSQERYGGEEGFAQYNVPRVKALGFNSAGFWTTPRIREQMRKLNFPYFLNLGLMPRDERYQLKDKDGLSLSARGRNPVVDPFNPEWRQLVLQATANLPREDPYLIGYFIDNEIGIMGPEGSGWGHLYDYFYSAYTFPVFVELLTRKYGTIARLNEAWSSPGRQYAYSSFAQIKQDPPQVQSEKDPALIDLQMMERRIVQELIEFPLQAIRRADPNHLVVGLRFAGTYYPEYLDLFAAYDVNSINIYNGPYADQLSYAYYLKPKQIAELTGKPVIITEFSFKADDSGLPNDRGAGCKVRTQEERASGYAAALTALAGQPWVIGAHYFSWQDSDTSERSNYGVVNWQEQMYRPLAAAMQRLNPHIYELALQAKDDQGVISTLISPAQEGSTQWIGGGVPYFLSYTYQTVADPGGWLFVGEPFVQLLGAETDYPQLLARPRTIFSLTDYLSPQGRALWEAPLTHFFADYQVGTLTDLGAENILVDDFESGLGWEISNWAKTGQTDGSQIQISPAEHFTGNASLRIDYSLTGSGLDHFMLVKEGQWNLKTYNGLEFALKGNGSKIRLAIFLMDSRGIANARYYGYNAPFIATGTDWVRLSLNLAEDPPLVDGGANLEDIRYLGIMINDGSQSEPQQGSIYLDDLRLLKLPTFIIGQEEITVGPEKKLVRGTPRPGIQPVIQSLEQGDTLLWEDPVRQQYFLTNPSLSPRALVALFSYLQGRFTGKPLANDGFIHIGDLRVRYTAPQSGGGATFDPHAWFFYDREALKVSDARWSSSWQTTEAETGMGCFKLLRVAKPGWLEFTLIGLTEATVYPEEMATNIDLNKIQVYRVGPTGNLLPQPFTRVEGGGIRFAVSGNAYSYLLTDQDLPSSGYGLRNLEVLPNPFSPDGSGGRDVLNIAYELTGAPWGQAKVRVAVYNLEGRVVRQIWQGEQTTGGQFLSWDGRDNYGRKAPNGLYLCRVELMGTKEKLMRAIVIAK